MLFSPEQGIYIDKRAGEFDREIDSLYTGSDTCPTTLRTNTYKECMGAIEG